MLIAKLIIITIFLYFSSKAFGILISSKVKLKNNEYIGIGYLTNISFFFVSTFIVMFLKLSYLYLLIFGTIYLIVAIIAVIKTIIDKKLFKFSKIELFALLLSVLIMIIYGLVVNFGYIETYDSYFYSLFTQSGMNSEFISVTDPYTGLSSLQNFYKYISFYYMPSYFASIMSISHAYLVLIWPIAFMNYLFTFITALSIVRLSKRMWINNILSVFVLTLIPNMFRAPFNSLHIFVAFISIYCFIYTFIYLKGDDSKLPLILICIIAGISISSTALFTLFFLILLIALALTIKRKEEKYKKIFYISLPVSFLGFLYMYESLSNIYVMLIWLIITTIIYYLIKSKLFLKILTIVGRVAVVVIILFLIFLPKKEANAFINTYFMNKNTDTSIIENKEDVSEINACYIKINEDYNTKDTLIVDSSIHSTSMNYVYNNDNNMFNIITTLLTHSLFMYGGMLFLFIYGFFKKRKDLRYIVFILYILIVFNPLTFEGINIITLDLGGRIVTFFNTFFALLGIRYFFAFIWELLKEFKHKKFVFEIFDKLYFVYALLVIMSLALYVGTIDKLNDNFKDYDMLYKVPKDIMNLNLIIDESIGELDYKPKVLYSASVFNISLLDEHIDNKNKITNSKDYANYFGEGILTNKIVLSAYFETAGEINIENIFIKDDDMGYEKDCHYDILNLIDINDIEYFVVPYVGNSEHQKFISENFEILKETNKVQILKRGIVNE